MSAKKFLATEALDNLTDEQLQTHYLQACEYFKIPPEANVLMYAWLDGEMGRHRVLYARKGATDIFRERLGIDTTELNKDDGPGYVSFTAVGKNKNGRVERAVGAVGTEGLRGQALAAAVMTAQTRALRRMTLQFVGGGLLDETEVQDSSVSVKASTPPALKETGPQVPPAPIVMSARDPMTTITGDPAKDFPPEARAFPTKAQLEAQKTLAAVKPEVLAKAAGEIRIGGPDDDQPPTDPKLQLQPLPAAAVVTEPTFESPKRRSRKKEQVTFEMPFKLDLPGVMLAPVGATPSPAAEKIVEEARKIETTPVKVSQIETKFVLLDAPATVPQPSSATIVVAPTPEVKAEPAAPVLDATQVKAFRDRLFKYTNDIFPKAGMVPSVEGGGIAQKVRSFAQAKFKVPLTNLTAEQWESLFSYWDGVIKEYGAQSLVKIIDDVAEGKADPWISK